MKIVSTEQIRALDARTMAAGTPGEVLMERAGFAVAQHASALLRQHGGQSVLLLAGKGNNGGDAIVAARHLAAAGYRTTLALLCRGGDLTGDPLTHFGKLLGAEVREAVTPAQLPVLAEEAAPALIVDGLLGTGLTGAVRDPYAGAIQFINDTRLPVLAIDLPSGLDSDTGEVRGVAVCAELTLTMGLPKRGLLQPAATNHVGRLEVAGLGFPGEFVDEIATDAEYLVTADVRPLLPRRLRDAHKGDFGHLLIIAGSEGYTGAPVLTAHAAARTGAGLVTLAVPREVYPIIAAQCPPEVMPRPLDRLESLAGFDAVAIGPGLGRAEGLQRQVLAWIDGCRVPLVVDADGLNALASNTSVLNRVMCPPVLTPHPGEMARLTGRTVAEVQERRWENAREFAATSGVVLALKGAGTVIADKTGRLWINSTGNPGMAKGGVGDALTGIIGALLAQGLAPLEATRAGVFVHGLAGDIAAERWGQRAMLASDLIASLGEAFALR